MAKIQRPQGGEGCVLIIDDEKPIRESLEELLTVCGFTPLSAKSYKDAVSALDKKADDIDAVLCDLKMPGKSGIEVLRYINKKEIGIPLIFLTGYATLESCQEAVREGAFDYIMKPIDNKDKIVFPLKHAVEKRRLERKNREMQLDIIRMAEEHQKILEPILSDAETKEKVHKHISGILDKYDKDK